MTTHNLRIDDTQHLNTDYPPLLAFSSCLIHLSPDPVPEPEETEFIEKRLVKLNGLYDELVKLQNEEKYAVDARLYHFAWALKLSGMVKDLGGQKGKF